MENKIGEDFRSRLNRGMLAPSHVFKRNPYFLSLLVSYLRLNQDTVRDGIINFDYLMRRYLEREALRPYASAHASLGGHNIDRKNVFNEYEKISRAWLQSFAYQSCTNKESILLYNRVTLDINQIKYFIDDISSRKGDNYTLWGNLNNMFESISKPRRKEKLSNEEIESYTIWLHENDIKLVDDLALRLRIIQENRKKIGKEILQEALGTIPFKGMIEKKDWYSNFTSSYQQLLEKEDFSFKNNLIAIFLFRSIAAAQILRIIYVETDEDYGVIHIKFRHRRLAEYYAACYFKDNWNLLKDNLQYFPWLGPVLNLTSAIEGEACRTLDWLVSQVDEVGKTGRYLWRYSVETVVEAAYFSYPGDRYSNILSRFLDKIINVLAFSTVHNGQNGGINKIDTVTKIVILRAIDLISRLKDNFSKNRILSKSGQEKYYAYEQKIDNEWIAPVIASRVGVKILSQDNHPTKNSILILKKAIKQPSSILVPNIYSVTNGPILLKPLLVFTTLLGEVGLLALTLGVFNLILYPIGILLKTNFIELIDSLKVLSFAIAFSYICIRLIHWGRSPTNAAIVGTSLWRIKEVFSAALKSITEYNFSPLLTALSNLVWKLRYLFPFLGLYFAMLFFYNKKPTPCPEMNRQRDILYSKYDSLRKVVPESRFAWIQEQLRDDLISYSKQNVDRCGYRQDDGSWLLMEDRLADRLFKLDHRLIPASFDNSPDLIKKDEFIDFVKLLKKEQIALPTQGVTGSLSSITKQKEVVQMVNELKDEVNRFKQGRRRGLSVPAKYLELIEEEPDSLRSLFLPENSEKLLSKIDSNINSMSQIEKELRGRARSIYFYGASVLILLSLFTYLIYHYLRRKKEKGDFANIERMTSIAALSQFILDRDKSERHRKRAISRIDRLSIDSEDELNTVEQTVNELMASNFQTDKNLGVEMASLVKKLSNRLRHKVGNNY